MLRLAHLEDLAAVQGVTAAAYEPYRALLGGPPLPVTEDYAPRIQRGEVWVWEQKAAISALAVFERHADHLMIFSLAVAPACQGQGLGIQLLKFADEKAAEWGLPEVRLYTNSRMERNIALYCAYGFQETGRRPNPYRPGWTLVDMAKTIKD
ncbi:MAG TPA: N-acetyltransferase [Ensifer sp.]|jgi:ribosomal protein S18 acetylase RimI-like enzyme|uniref:GNAT family N-acetyltransferase n=1 Tax=Ensifer sp. TaxID=1872086 RepID=UPI002E127FE2|nr:N-acetyltransferase [Ensifer sp.]